MLFPARYCVLLLFGLSFSEVVAAQSVYGTIKGALTLNTGVPVSQALVLVSALDRGDQLQFSAKTDDSGYFVIGSLPPGAYRMQMQKKGFKTHEEPLVAVSADTTSEVNVKLTQGDPAERELGDGSAISILKVDRTDVSTSFTRDEIEALPIFRQNTALYESLVPGAIATRPVLPPEQNPQDGPYVSIGGQHFSGTTVLIDGTVDRDPLEGIVVLNPSIESVSELKITTQNYGAEFGPATTGVVSVQTKSGTNTVHGAAFGFQQSDLGQATQPDFGQTSVLTSATEKRSDFGGALGGPLKKDRIFIFGDYRGVRASSSGAVLLTVPTQLVHDTCLGPASPMTFCNLSQYSPFVTFTAAFPMGLIRNSKLSPQMLPFFQRVPLPTVPDKNQLTNNFSAPGVDTFSDDSFNIRLDDLVSNTLKLFGRYSFANFRENGTPAFGPALGGVGANPFGFAGTVKDRNQGVSTGFSYNLSSSLLTDFRFGYFRYNLANDSPDEGTSPATQANILGLNLSNDFYSSGMPDFQLDNTSTLQVAGGLNFLRLGYSPGVNTCNCPLREREQQFQFVSNWTKLQSKHAFRWGADIRYLQNFRLSSEQRRSGHLEFSSGATGFSLGDFLLGAVANFDRAYNPNVTNAGERQTRMFFYGEDTWRVNSRLSLNYGLRWEIYRPQSVTRRGAGGWLDLGSGASAADRFLVAGEAGINLEGNVQTTLHNFGPRLGLAYLISRDTVIRAGYGRAFDPGYGGSIFGIAATQSPPVGVITTVTNGFTINSSADPSTTAPISICVNGPCTVPAFNLAPSPLTIQQLFSINTIASPNSKLSASDQQANLYALPRRLRLPTVDAWNVAVQHALDRRTYFEIAYVGNKGTHVFNDSSSQVSYYDFNQPTLAGLVALSASGNCTHRHTTDTYCKTTDVSRQPFQPWTSEIRYFGNDASSNYNSLQVKVRHQMTFGLNMLAAYTWAKVLDYDNVYYGIDPKVGHGVGNFDRTHSFIMTNTWSLPVGRGRFVWGDAGPVVDRIVGGWSIAGITRWSSGFPFTPAYQSCNVDIGGPVQYRPCRPNLVGAVHITGSRSQYFTTTGGKQLQPNCAPKTTPCPAFEQGFNTETGLPVLGETIDPWQRPGAGQIGNVGRNSLRAPGFFQADLSVAKNIPVTERVVVRFRADAFNVFNTVNLGTPSPVVDSGSGGQISSLAVGAMQRQMQFSLRVEF